MIFTPHYTITVSGTEIHFLFNDWALKQLCKKQGIELGDLQNRILKTVQPEAEHLKDVKALNDLDVEDILFCGHQSWCAYNKLPFEVTDLDMSMWFDELGGRINGEYTPMFTAFFSRIFNVDPDKTVVEKKSVEEVMHPQEG